MFKNFLAATAFLLSPSITFAQNLPSQDDLRGLVYFCSGGLAVTGSAKFAGDVDAFVSLLRRGISAEIEGGVNQREIESGQIFERLYSEDAQLKVFAAFQDCLERHVGSLLSATPTAPPNIHKGEAFSVSAYEARQIGDLIFLSLGASGFRQSFTFGLDYSSVRVLTSNGSVYTIGDGGGWINCDGSDAYCGSTVDSTDSSVALLTLEHQGGKAPDSSEKTLTFNARFTFVGKTFNVGLRSIPVIVLD